MRSSLSENRFAKRRRLRPIFAALVLAAVCGAMGDAAAPQPTAREASIRLKDGARIVGRITQLKDEVYWIEDSLLGSRRIPVEEVDGIEYGAVLPVADSTVVEFAGNHNAIELPTEPPEHMKGRVQEWIVRAILSNEALRTILMQLQDDEQMRDVLDDPEIRKAIEENNLRFLFASEKVRALAKNTTVRQMIRGLLGRGDPAEGGQAAENNGQAENAPAAPADGPPVR